MIRVCDVYITEEGEENKIGNEKKAASTDLGILSKSLGQKRKTFLRCQRTLYFESFF